MLLLLPVRLVKLAVLVLVLVLLLLLLLRLPVGLFTLLLLLLRFLLRSEALLLLLLQGCRISRTSPRGRVGRVRGAGCRLAWMERIMQSAQQVRWTKRRARTCVIRTGVGLVRLGDNPLRRVHTCVWRSVVRYMHAYMQSTTTAATTATTTTGTHLEEDRLLPSRPPGGLVVRRA
jgi:hypothetical protein